MIALLLALGLSMVYYYLSKIAWLILGLAAAHVTPDDRTVGSTRDLAVGADLGRPKVKVLCLIDSLSSGAQRQLCTLAVLLKQQGMDVSMLTYHPHDFFLPILRVR